MNLILILILAPILATAAFAGISAAPWLPTKPKQRRHLIDNLELKQNATCYDLGCGDGTLLFALARKFPTAKAIGYEISLLPFLIGTIRKFIGGKKYKNVSLRFGNLFLKNLSEADLVLVFLLDKSYPKLKKKFSEELKDNAKIVVEAWPMPGIEPKKRLKEENLLPVFIYTGSQFR
jgi:precorrin-6B methylase 2